jgi:hypothetical protein
VKPSRSPQEQQISQLPERQLMKRHSTSLLAAAVTALLALASAPSTRAGITFQIGNHPQPGEENVLLNSGATGSTVTGTTNLTGALVDFSSATQTLSEPSSGQARIAAVNGSGAQVALQDVTITVPHSTYQDLILNPFLNGGHGPGAPGNATVTVVANDGTFQFTYALGHGQNFLTIFATGGEKILSTNLSAGNGFTDLRQPRISGIASVPEPSTLTLAGLGCLGVLASAWWRHRSRSIRSLCSGITFRSPKHVCAADRRGASACVQSQALTTANDGFQG